LLYHNLLALIHILLDYILEDKYILKKPVPAETVDSEKYAEKYMLNPDLTYS